jgi:hypothetical protein
LVPSLRVALHCVGLPHPTHTATHINTVVERSHCVNHQAGYKALWSRASGMPNSAFFDAARPGFSQVLEKVKASSYPSPGQPTGGLVGADALRAAGLAGLVGIPEGTPVSAAAIDAHAAVPGVGVSDPNVMVMVLGTSSCYMVSRPIPPPPSWHQLRARQSTHATSGAPFRDAYERPVRSVHFTCITIGYHPLHVLCVALTLRDPRICFANQSSRSR